MSTLVLMEFVIKQLAITVPPTDQVKTQNKELISRLPKEMAEELESVIDKAKGLLGK